MSNYTLKKFNTVIIINLKKKFLIYNDWGIDAKPFTITKGGQIQTHEDALWLYNNLPF